MTLTFARFLEASGGRFVADAATLGATFRPCTDSRTITRGETFVCLRGPNFDGHSFIANALAAGASAIVVDDDATVPSAISVPVVRVKDTKSAYLAGAAAADGDRPAALAFLRPLAADFPELVPGAGQSMLGAGDRLPVFPATLENVKNGQEGGPLPRQNRFFVQADITPPLRHRLEEFPNLVCGVDVPVGIAKQAPAVHGGMRDAVAAASNGVERDTALAGCGP